MSDTLSAGQKAVLHFITHYVEANGFPPTIREIQKAIGHASSSTVVWHLHRLRDLGYVSQRPGESRTLRVIRVPDE